MLLAGLATACAGQMPARDTAPAQVVAIQSPEEALRARATALWEARVKNDWVTQYNVLEPKAREGVTLTGFALARGTVVFLSHTITEVEVVGDQGRVTTEAKFRLTHPKAGRFGPWDQSVFMRWVREDGVWYLKEKQDDADKPLKSGENQP
jgi:hypothetical protein